MSHDATTESLLFPEISSKPVVARFSLQRGNSDGGTILLKVVDRRMRLTEALAARLTDPRQAGNVEHEVPGADSTE